VVFFSISGDVPQTSKVIKVFMFANYWSLDLVAIEIGHTSVGECAFYFGYAIPDVRMPSMTPMIVCATCNKHVIK
jgi:hypothetical protein